MKGLLVLVLLVSALAVRTFHGNQVLRVFPTSPEHVALLSERYHKGDRRYDFWSEPTAVGKAVDIHLEASHVESARSEFIALGMNVSTFISNVQELIDQQMKRDQADPFLDVYHTYDEVIQWTSMIQRKFPHLVNLMTIGKSTQGRDLVVMELSSNKSSNPVGAWYDGGLHAREWITVATVLWMTNQLLEDYGKDPIVTQLLDNMIIYVLPVFNPDGYVYSWTTDRMWRKTRSVNQGSSCIGTDPNRNWDFHWGEAGTSTNPCSDSFEGRAPFSEPEPRTVGLFIKNSGIIQGYINFHSYSQLWMSPWGYTTTLPRDYQTQNSLSASCVSALTRVFGTQYQYGPISTTIYPASGSSADYTYGVANVLYSYGVELRDQGQYGFLLPPREIDPSGQETYQALKVWLQQVLKTKPSQ